MEADGSGSDWVDRADGGWTRVEMGELALGDIRLERRLRRVAEELSQQPEYPINLASQDAAATKAAYRLFDNEKVSSARILSCHRKNVIKRAQSEPVVLAIQDTTVFNFTSHKKTRGLGPIGKSEEPHKGLFLHSVLAVTPYGLPLGVLSHRCWAREDFVDSANTYQDRPLHEKESYRWVQALREVSELSLGSATTVVHVGDRECDIYEFLREAQGANARFLIRASYDRRVESADEVGSVQRHLGGMPPQALLELRIPTQKRTAHLELRFSSVVLRAPQRIVRKERVSVQCWVVNVVERTPPEGHEPLSWTLLTNVGVHSIEDAVERLSWYQRRWSIEEFHKVLKSGCLVEDCRLQTAERLKRYLALFCVIAWRIFWMTHIARADPNSSALVVLGTQEIGALSSLKRFKDKHLNAQTMTVRQAVVAIAALGGHLARRSDPPPGTQCLWRGWQRLASMTEMYDSMVERSG
jgi:hypothetical protein